MTVKWKQLIPCVLIPLAVGGAAAWVTRGNMEIFEYLRKPPLAPPGWLFPVVWTILYALMGIASYLILSSGAEMGEIRGALTFYGAQLAVNFVWPILFFNAMRFCAAFWWIVLLWVLVLATVLRFDRISAKARNLMLPYLVWVTFAAYLNFGIYRLN